MSKTRAAAVVSTVAGRGSARIVLAVALVIGVVTSPFITRLQSVTIDDQLAFLPAGSPSADLVRRQRALSAADTLEITVVYARPGGQLTEQEGARVEGERLFLAQRYPAMARPPAAQFSESRRAAIVELAVPGVSTDEAQTAEVTALRSALAQRSPPGEGVVATLTGPGAYVADFEGVYEQIDLTLLLATGGIVALVLLVTYRSPTLWAVPLVVVVIADAIASWLLHSLAINDVVTLDGSSAGILPVLVFGVGTDYALLLVARYREELHARESTATSAMQRALRRTAPTILASAAVVMCGLACLLVSRTSSNRALAIVGVLGIGTAAFAVLTVLPALLVVLGRRVFWPLVPRPGTKPMRSRVWRSLAERVTRRPVLVATTTASALLVLCAGVVTLDTGLAPVDSFRDEPASVRGQRTITEAFSSGTAEPLLLVVNTRTEPEVRAALSRSGEVAVAAVIDRSRPGPNPDCTEDPAGVLPCVDRNGTTQFAVQLRAQQIDVDEVPAIDALRRVLDRVEGADAVLGGGPAERLDVSRAAERDRSVVIPLVLAAVFVVFCLVLRAIVAPAVLLAGVVLSYLAAIGATAVVSRAFGFPAVDETVILLAFVFLVALGVDYSVFLAGRIREDAGRLGTKRATVEGLVATGGVITSAGAVLGATFVVLAVVPLVPVTQLSFAVAFGVLLDTFVVRAVLVPAVFSVLAERAWWPAGPPAKE